MTSAFIGIAIKEEGFKGNQKAVSQDNGLFDQYMNSLNITDDERQSGSSESRMLIVSFLLQKDKYAMIFVPCFRNEAVLPVPLLLIVSPQLTVEKTTVMARPLGQLYCFLPSGVGSFKTGISSYMRCPQYCLCAAGYGLPLIP